MKRAQVCLFLFLPFVVGLPRVFVLACLLRSCSYVPPAGTAACRLLCTGTRHLELGREPGGLVQHVSAWFFGLQPQRCCYAVFVWYARRVQRLN
jgi:hypothetical protein